MPEQVLLTRQGTGWNTAMLKKGRTIQTSGGNMVMKNLLKLSTGLLETKLTDPGRYCFEV